MKLKRLAALFLTLALALSMLSGCNNSGSNETKQPNSDPSPTQQAGETDPTNGPDAAPDTITALLPPISNQYLDRVDEIAAAFHDLYPNLTLEIESASWDDRIEKLDTQVNAGSPPDIAFLGVEYISKYVDMGVAVDITNYATPDMLADYDETPLEYMKQGGGLYGFPAYMEIHGIGGNREYMEAAGIDWKSIQTKGWTFEEFEQAVKNGVGVQGANSTSEYGFVFATAGTTTKNFIEIFAKNAGMPSEFNADQKYTYTSKNFLDVLNAAATLMEDGSYMNATAGERWNMFLLGQTMFTGKGLATFENSAKTNNKKIETNSEPVEGSVPVDYIVMPVPTMNGADPAYYAVVDGYMVFRGKETPTDEHMQNVVKAAYFLASGTQAAQTNAELFAINICDTARAAESSFPLERDANNLACVEYLTANAAKPSNNVPADLQAKATKLMDEVIVPKFQALLAKELSPQDMYDAVYEAAVDAFGEDGIVKD